MHQKSRGWSEALSAEEKEKEGVAAAASMDDGSWNHPPRNTDVAALSCITAHVCCCCSAWWEVGDGGVRSA